MDPAQLPLSLPILFTLLVIGVSALWIYGIADGARKAGFTDQERRRLGMRSLLVLAAWLAFTGVLAIRGVYLDTDSMPPKILLIAAPAIIAGIVLARLKTAARILDATEPSFIVGAQSFRLVIEILFYFLLINNAMPELMTFEGRNMDIIVGLTALPFAMLYKRGKISDHALRIWNYVGLAILFNVMIHGILSSPSPMQQIQTVPVNDFMLHFPFVWLIALLVPTALTGHLLSLRQLALRRAKLGAIAIA